MASKRRRPGLGRGLEEIIAQAEERLGEPTPGYDELFRQTENPEGGPSPREPRDREPREFKEPSVGRRKPGLGEKGISRIRQELEGLPPPEEIHPIAQSTKGGFSTPRPDRHVEFYSAAGNKQSTRVASAQWIPTEMFKSGVVGDLFIAFARPHKGKSTLFLYKNVSEKTWSDFKNTTSFGKFIPRLGEYSDHSDVEYDFYRKLHPDNDWWIFSKSWTTIRENNESVVGGKAPRGTAARVASSALEKAAQRKRERESGM